MSAVLPDLQFDEPAHVYKLGGDVVPSVTEILRPLMDFSRVPAEVLEYKRSLGKAVHKCIELWERQDLDLDTVDPEALPYFEGWMKFKQESGFRAMVIEQPIASRKLRVAGTPDVLGTREETLDELLDVKCTYAMDPATAIQTAGYDLILEETGIRIKKRGAVQLKPDGTYRFHSFKDRMDRTVFLSCLNIANFLRNHK